MEMRRYRQLFLEESREHLTRMGQLQLLLEELPQDRELLDEFFREAHSLKSMASAMGYAATARLAHHLEETLATWRDSGTMPAGAPAHLLAGVDLLEKLLEDLAAERPERDISGFFHSAQAAAPSTATPPVTPGQPVYQVTVDLATDTPVPAARALLLLRDLQTQGEILNATPTVEMLRQGQPCRRLQVWLRTTVSQTDMAARLRAVSDIEQLSFLNDRRSGKGQQRWARTERTVRVRIELIDQLLHLSGALLNHREMLGRAVQARDWEQLDAALAAASPLIAALRQDVLHTRLLPLEVITGRLPRLARDLAMANGKQVEFRLLGGGVLFDREILEALAEPLMHLVRNAVVHGLVAGVHGEVQVAGRLDKDAVLIEVSDDGRGLEPAVIKQKAQAMGLLSPGQAAALTEKEALRLICLPGFSTASAVSESSGHGVGMDVVKTTVDKLGGTLEIHSTPGAGCRIQLRFPLTPASASARLGQADPDAKPLAETH